MPQLKVKKGSSFATDPAGAVREVAEAIAQPDTSISILFISSKYNLDEMGKALQGTFQGPVIGCTTAGEITSALGYREGGIVGVSLSSAGLIAHPRLIEDLARFDIGAGEALVSGLRSELKLCTDLDPARMFSFLLVDGLSMMEEQVVALLEKCMDGVTLIGGSAGDDINFKETHVYFNGRFIKNAAVFTLFETTLPFKAFHVQHFTPTETRLVITESDCATRTVTEINGGPAAEEYARAVGLEISELNPHIFAAHPVMLAIGGAYYVRSIQKVNPDGSLTFFCAIDSGLVLTVGKGGELAQNLAASFTKLRSEVQGLKFILGCDCILRRLELKQKDQFAAAGGVLKDVDFVGFSTYGEQFNGIHVNQTLTGIALGE